MVQSLVCYDRLYLQDSEQKLSVILPHDLETATWKIIQVHYCRYSVLLVNLHGPVTSMS